ncbi:polyadenylation and cleavage factor homolog 4 [Amaranthus tricolor]|uniref:polyadenylation and cleavage factor homolog 4 n=1 Tax=Amaranthus tricolor TaxID=29722 RepID=UPI0025867416|nr:polyadenylation and cleavage factor homolog 4 [Amaranthus tricolor]
MEMESSRRPQFDRSRDLIAKKPRLTEESAALSGRQFQQPLPQQRSVIGSGSGASRFRTNTNERDRDSDDSSRDSSRGSLQQFQQHQELVNQYKNALAELTFNSKPIITNLTIIAGENLQAAKAIAATICANIIEVPRDQKLPSLYLLDSIVKNIGRDYIKHFAARLPEVFCKAYRLVDPSIHAGMRHLFGTWKGVFPAQSLQIIEKELGFPTSANGPSSGTIMSKSDSQSQRQSHSIHVNPKYLEARQRLQQSSKMKSTDAGLTDVDYTEDVEKPDRTTGVGTERSWMNPSLKLHNIRPQREPLREDGLHKEGGVSYGDYEFVPGLSRPVGTSGAKPSERIIGQRRLGDDSEGEESISVQRNGYDIKRGIPNYVASSIPSLQNQPRNVAVMSRSWRNSEEEEYMWDDLGTKATDPGATAITKKEIWSDDLERVELGSHLPKWQSQTEVRSNIERELSVDTLSSEQKEQVPFGLLRSSLPSPAGGSSYKFPTSVSASTVRHPSPGKSVVNQPLPSPSISKRDPRQNLIEKEHMRSHPFNRSDPRLASLPGQLSTGVRDKGFQDTILAQNQNLNLPKSQGKALQKPPSPSFPQSHISSSEQLSNSETELSGVSQKAQQLLGSSLKGITSLDSPNPITGNLQGQSNVSSLLAAVMKSGLLAGNSVPEQIGVQSPSTTLISSGPSDSTATISQSKVEKPTLVPHVSSPMSNSLAPTLNAAAAKSNPLSILSTLLSKGLITAPKTEAAPSVSAKSEDQLLEQSPTVETTTIVTDSSVSVASDALPESSTKMISSLDSKGKTLKTVESTKEEVEDLIGFEFRPRVLRDLHPAVIDKLSDNLPHRCTECGLHFKLQERLARHSEWHALKNSIRNCLNKPTRRWYSTSSDWISGKVGFPFGYSSACIMDDTSETREENEKMVPADESQCVCLLCGEVFEDFYSQERNEWMFKGVVYFSTTSESTGAGSCSDSSSHNLIVHANCMSGYSGHDLRIIRGIKKEKDT